MKTFLLFFAYADFILKKKPRLNTLSYKQELYIYLNFLLTKYLNHEKK